MPFSPKQEAVRVQSFESVIELQGILFLLLAAGIILRRVGVIDGKGRRYLTDLLIDLVQHPAQRGYD